MPRALVVEHDPMNVAVITKTLQRIGRFEVLTSNDPAEVLRLASDGKVDVVLMDVALGGPEYRGRPMDGTAITRLLKSDPQTRSVPVLLVTAKAMRGDAERLLSESGADGYVSKPIANPRDLVDRIYAIITAKRQEPADIGG